LRHRSARDFAVLVVVLVLGLAAGRALAVRYSVAPQDQSYITPARQFLTAAMTADSTELARVAAPHVIVWALETARAKPALLRALLDGLRETTARQAGENTLVLYSSNGFGSCGTAPLAITFEGPPSDARLVALSADCEPRR
jgi:Tfp pilus assembly protein PilV